MKCSKRKCGEKDCEFFSLNNLKISEQEITLNPPLLKNTPKRQGKKFSRFRPLPLPPLHHNNSNTDRYQQKQRQNRCLNTCSQIVQSHAIIRKALPMSDHRINKNKTEQSETDKHRN